MPKKPDVRRAEKALGEFLDALGLDRLGDPHLRETPARVTDAFVHDFLAGYAVDVGALIRKNAMKGKTSGPITAKHLPVATLCPHHLLPSIGTAAVTFLPNASLIGIGAIANVVDSLARRLTLQESLGEEIVSAISSGLRPKWVVCHLSLQHMCLVARGERVAGSVIETVAARGRVPSEWMHRT